MSEILGFGSTAQVGKDTAANHLEEVFPDAKRVAFADKIKQVAMLVFGLSYDQCYGSVEVKEKVDPRYGLTPREIFQGIGENMRKIYEDIWADAVFNTTIPDLEKQGYTKFVISDVRYPNEARKIKRQGGSVVRIDRDGAGVSVGKSHASETAMKDYHDYTAVVENNGTLDEFFASIETLVEELGWQKLKEEKEQVQRVEA